MFKPVISFTFIDKYYFYQVKFLFKLKLGEFFYFIYFFISSGESPFNYIICYKIVQVHYTFTTLNTYKFPVLFSRFGNYLKFQGYIYKSIFTPFNVFHTEIYGIGFMPCEDHNTFRRGLNQRYAECNIPV